MQLLMCLQFKKDCETIFLDTKDLVQCLKEDNIELLNQLIEEDLIHERSGDKRIEKVIKEYKKIDI